MKKLFALLSLLLLVGCGITETQKCTRLYLPQSGSTYHSSCVKDSEVQDSLDAGWWTAKQVTDSSNIHLYD